MRMSSLADERHRRAASRRRDGRACRGPRSTRAARDRRRRAAGWPPSGPRSRAATSSCCSKKSVVKAHRITSRCVKPTPRVGTRSRQHENMRRQNGPGIRVRAAERGREQAVGVGDRVLLRDHAAHRDAEQMEALEAERVDEAGEVVGHLRRAVRPGRRRRLADAAIVVADDAIALGERRDLRLPRLLRRRRGR